MSGEQVTTELTAPGKLVALCIVLAGCVGYIIASLFVSRVPDTTPAWATITLISGYLIGNGTGARKGIATVGVWEPRRRATDPPPAPAALPPAAEVEHDPDDDAGTVTYPAR